MPKQVSNKIRKSWNLMFFWKGKTLILSAKHHSVVQKQGSRGSVVERFPYAKMTKIPWRIHPQSLENPLQIYENSMQNPCLTKWHKNMKNQSTMATKREPKTQYLRDKTIAEKWLTKNCQRGILRTAGEIHPTPLYENWSYLHQCWSSPIKSPWWNKAYRS
jgi:hypothetical protein